MHSPILFEVAWEVANKVGGIYTVIKSKVPITVSEFGANAYFLIGPYRANHAALEVETLSSEFLEHRHEDPSSHVCTLNASLQTIRSYGIKIVFGRWLIEGSPFVILLDLDSCKHKLPEWKLSVYEQHGIACPPEDREMSEAIAFGYLAAWLLTDFQHKLDRQQAGHPEEKVTLIAHCHEWMAGLALVLLARQGAPIARVFTTHATLLGRFLCAGQVDFYNTLSSVDVDYEAGRRGIYHRYCMERGAAHSAHVFTTVSHITAYEAEHLLKRKPDGVLPNGLNIIKFSAMHEFQNLHAENKAKINAFVQGHFYGHYDFNLDNTLYFFTAGRYEYRNKGVDLFLEALARLNAQLKHFNSPTTVVAFIIMPAATKSYTVETLKGQAITKQLHDTVQDIQKRIGSRIYESALKGNIPSATCLLSEQEIVSVKRYLFALKRDTLPPVVTHNMVDDASDPILNEVRRLGLFNAPSDRVKVIYHPEFLSSHHPVLGLDYEDFVRGCHLGVFPSYYEPWGYTPAECTVMGIPSITTNLSGFGCYIDENVEGPSDYGIFIVDRRLKSVEESIGQLVAYMLSFCSQSRRQRIHQRNRTERLSEILDWKRMGIEYKKARGLALRRAYPELFRDEEEEDVEEHGGGDGSGENSNDTIGPLEKIPKPLSAPSSPKISMANIDVEDEEEELVGSVATRLGQLDLPSSTKPQTE